MGTTHGIDQLGLRVHKQIIISGYVINPPKDTVYMKTWFENLIKTIDMKILNGPHLVYCDMEGNRGLTGIAIIETSHIALHSWDEISPGLIELDIFSCKYFDPNDVIDALREFGLVGIDFKCIDRTHKLTDEKMWVVYKTTNTVNNKVYVGVHGDYTGKYDYLGSGKALKAAIKKYGKENFSHSIIKLFDSADKAFEFEKMIVDAEFVNDPNTYNLSCGGTGNSTLSEEIKKKIGSKNQGKSYCKWITNGDENLLIKKDDVESFILENPKWYYGRIISDEVRDKLSEVRKGNPSHRKVKLV
jgi:S-adenosylmethionine/arginine decarboxylase-like enzyme